MHVRGSRAKGEVVKDYAVGAPNDSGEKEEEEA
jgi:hypothetical protein